MTEENPLQVIKSNAVKIRSLSKEIIELAEGGPVIPDSPPDPEPPTIPYPELARVTMKKNAPLLEISHYNKKDRPVLRRHLKIENDKPIVAKEGKDLIVLGKVRIDGYKNYAFRLLSDQPVDGLSSLPPSNTRHEIPGSRNPKKYDRYLYIQKRLVKV